MTNPKDLKVQYVLNDKGDKTGVILPVEEFEELIEDLGDLAVVAERRDEPTKSHDGFC
ncbi:MAG: hypothetical protein HYZ01_01515 [Ignavibacteriales bacterium]|nr:hypothetical protein [Ignavibacteriales bacterium]